MTREPEVTLHGLTCAEARRIISASPNQGQTDETRHALEHLSRCKEPGCLKFGQQRLSSADTR